MRTSRPALFDIDREKLGDADTLDDLTPVEAFVHGAEWGIIWEMVQSPEAMVFRVQASNVGRIARMLTKQRRTFVVRELPDGFAEISLKGLC
jgi:hypothetical protein